MAMISGVRIGVMRRFARFCSLALILAGLLALPIWPAGAQYVIDFESLTTPVRVYGQYNDVTFNGPRAMKHTPRITGIGVVAIELCYGVELCTTPLVMDVSSGHNGISLLVGSSVARQRPALVVMRAYDADGALIGSATTVMGPSTGSIFVNRTLKVENSPVDIRRVTLGYSPNPEEVPVNNGLVVDDIRLTRRDSVALRLEAMEIVQATQTVGNGVPLVAGKPTVVRAFVTIDGATGPSVNVTGKLTAQRLDGATMGPISYTGPLETLPWFQARLRKQGALNFQIPQEWTDEEFIRFQLTDVSISGGAPLPCSNCARFAHFRKTRPVYLVLAPYSSHRTSPLQTPELILTPMGALQWMNNVYPVRGDFPANEFGIRILSYLPVETTRDGSLLDELQSRWTLLRECNPSWPDFSIMGTIAGLPGNVSGVARLDKRVSWVKTRSVSSDPVTATAFQRYGRLWSHELAHNFGRQHAGNAHGEDGGGGYDEDFPIRHGGIGDPGVATITNWWDPARSFMEPGVSAEGSMHEHDLMSYGNNRPGHTGFWISPYTYKALFAKLAVSGNAVLVTRPPVREVLVVIGHIDASGAISQRPFWRMSTSTVSSEGLSGEYRIELLDRAGAVLAVHYFDAERASDGTDLHFSEYVPWIDGTREIRLSGPDGELSRTTVSARAPQVRILAPHYDGRRSKLRVSWQAEDADSDSLWFSVLYNAGDDQPWLPVANQVTGRSVEVDTRLLPGSRAARLRIIATDGANTIEVAGEHSFSIDNKPPMVGILSPTKGKNRSQPGTVEFIGAAFDPEDGLLADRQLQWTSDRDGVLGKGSRLNVDRLSRGRHNVTLTARDSAGLNAFAVTTIDIVAGTNIISNP